MKKTIRLTESELTRLIKRIIEENNEVKENWISKMFKKEKPDDSTPVELSKKEKVDELTKELNHYLYFYDSMNIDPQEIGFYEREIKDLKKKIRDLGYSYNRNDEKSYPKF